MEIVQIDGRSFHLFLDIFVHWSGRKITAAAAYYGDDIDWSEHGVDLSNIELIFGQHRVVGQYIPHRLDTWEPCVLFDFESPALEACLRERDFLEFTIQAGPVSKSFNLATEPAAGHKIAMSIIIKDCNQWVRYFLDYYLLCLECDHVYIYDNNTRDREELLQILQPYAGRGQVTYIPWHYRWRNEIDQKQIGQIPHQAQCLNKYGKCNWIGFFDFDEFLRIPDRSLKQFLKNYDPSKTNGLSFNLRWFLYRGDLPLEKVGNPLLSFFESKPDPVGRRRQKLIVSPKNVRFLRIHWLEEGKNDTPVNDSDCFFHHYYLLPERFEEGKSEPGTTRDEYMLRFAEPLVAASNGQGSQDNTAKSENQILPKPHSVEQWITHVMNAFRLAEAEQSKLGDDILGLDGMCGRRNRIFLNALCAFENCRYLEIGSFKGASLCAAMSGNEIDAIAIENWSQFGGPREEFMTAVEKHHGSSKYRVIEQDCFTVDHTQFEPIDIYYYDGDHSADSQALAIKHFYDCLADRAVVIIDDWNWNPVRTGTRTAVAELDIPIIFDREIILPETDLVDMPRHRGRHSWWNGIYVMIIDKGATPISKRTQLPAIAKSHSVPADTRHPIEVIIFSKDRACQLEALLRSMEQFFQHPHRITVLFTASEPSFQAGYDLLMDCHTTVTWHHETDFKSDLLHMLDEARGRNVPKVMFLVDDIVFTRRFTGKNLMPLLDDENVLALSLRLGDSIRYRHPNRTVPPEFLENHKWAWREAHSGYWNYPMSLDGNIFRIDDLHSILPDIPFRNPNTLEAHLAGRPIDRPYLACPPSPYLINLALNLVQNVFNNPHGETPAANLNQSFLSGFLIDIRPFLGQEYSSCHIQPQISLIRCANTHLSASIRKASFPDVSASMKSTLRSQTLLERNLTPIRGRFVTTSRKGDEIIVKQRSKPGGFRLNETSGVVWNLCDGKNTIESICATLEQQYSDRSGAIRRDVIWTLAQFENQGFLTLKHTPDKPKSSK